MSKLKLSPFLLALPLLTCAIACGEPAGADKTVAGGVGSKKPTFKKPQQKNPKLPTIDTKAKPVPAKADPYGVAEARKAGLLIKGLKDAEGFKRVIEAQIKGSLNLKDPLFDTALAKELGALEELAKLGTLGDMLGNLDIYRIELIPGLDNKGMGLGDSLIPDPSNPGGSGKEQSEFYPGFPSKGSLTGHVTGYQEVQGPTHVRVTTYSDGSSYTQVTTDHGNGMVTNAVRTTNSDGTTRWYWMQMKENGNVIASDQRWGNTGQSEAHDEHGHNPPDSNAGGNDSGSGANDGGANDGGANDGGSNDDDGGEIPPNPYIDQYQPAEGGGGTFCPLTVEYCRRGLEKALASGAKVRVGIALVNPGEPDDQPKGNRLVYDPKDLVINPSLVDVAGPNAKGAPRFRMEIPVWVNPPGPND